MLLHNYDFAVLFCHFDLIFPISICAMPHAMIFIRRQKIMNSRVGNDSKIIIKWEWEKSVTRSFKGLWRNLVSLYKGNLICIILNWSYALHIRAILLIEDKIVLLLSIVDLVASVHCRFNIRNLHGLNVKQRWNSVCRVLGAFGI